MMQRMPRRQFLQYLIMGGGVVLTGSAMVWTVFVPVDPARHAARSGGLLDMVPQGSLPAFVQQGSREVQEVYRYAAAHGETLQYIPCFCSCTKIGHHHNGDCYMAERLPGGRITFTSDGAT